MGGCSDYRHEPLNSGPPAPDCVLEEPHSNTTNPLHEDFQRTFLDAHTEALWYIEEGASTSRDLGCHAQRHQFIDEAAGVTSVPTDMCSVKPGEVSLLCPLEPQG